MAQVNSPFNIEDRFNEHIHNGADSKKIKFSNLEIDKESAVTAPTGGLTVDQPSRDAINAIITRLENLGLFEEN